MLRNLHPLNDSFRKVRISKISTCVKVIAKDETVSQIKNQSMADTHLDEVVNTAETEPEDRTQQGTLTKKGKINAK